MVRQTWWCAWNTQRNNIWFLSGTATYSFLLKSWYFCTFEHIGNGSSCWTNHRQFSFITWPCWNDCHHVGPTGTKNVFPCMQAISILVFVKFCWISCNTNSRWGTPHDALLWWECCDLQLFRKKSLMNCSNFREKIFLLFFCWGGASLLGHM